MSFNVGVKSFCKVSDYLFFRQLTVNATKPFSVFQEKTVYHMKSLISAENMISIASYLWDLFKHSIIPFALMTPHINGTYYAMI
jgi:hypothetical protein